MALGFSPGTHEAALILETSADTTIIAIDAINANVAATAPIDRNGFFSISRAHRSQLTIRSLRRRARVTNEASRYSHIQIEGAKPAQKKMENKSTLVGTKDAPPP